MDYRFSHILVPVLWVMALVFALMPLTAFEAESFGVVFSLLCVCTLYAWAVGRPRIPRAAILWTGLAFWGLALTSVIFSEIKYTSFIYFCFFSALPLSVVVFLYNAKTERSLHYAAAGLGIIFALLAASSLIQFFFMPDMLMWGFVRYPFANPNSLGALLSLGFFGALGWMLCAKSRVQSNMALILAICIISAFWTTGTRAGALGMFVGLCVLLPLCWRHAKRHKRCCAVLLVGAVLSLITMSSFHSPEASSPGAQLLNSLRGQSEFLYSRPAIWAATWEMMKDHIWTGTGIGTFAQYYPEYRHNDPRSAGFAAHNDPLQFGAEMGISAMVLFYTILILAFARSARAFKHLAVDDHRRVLIAAPFCALGAMVMHSHGSFNFYILPTLMVAGFCFVFWFWQTEQAIGQKDEPVSDGNGAYTARLVLVSLTLLLWACFASLHGSYVLTKQAQDQLEAGDLDGFVSRINRADVLAGGRNERALILAATFPTGTLQMQGPVIPPRDVEALYEEAFAMLRRAEEINPRSPAILMYQAELIRTARQYGAQNDMPEPKKLLERARKLNPVFKMNRAHHDFTPMQLKK